MMHDLENAYKVFSFDIKDGKTSFLKKMKDER